MSELNAAIEDFRTAYDDLFSLIDQTPVAKCEEPGACGSWFGEGRCWPIAAAGLSRRNGATTATTRTIAAKCLMTSTSSMRVRSMRGRGRPGIETVAELRTLVTADHRARQGDSPEKAAVEERYGGWLEVLAEDCRDHTEEIRIFAGAI